MSNTRIVIVGTSGSGKSTLARQLSRLLNIPHAEMDAFGFGPNWYERSDVEIRKELEPFVDQPNWVIDGNYSRFHDLTVANATDVIWIDLSFPRTMYQVTKRTIRRSLFREELWSGNTETWRKSFASRESIILWAAKTWRRNRQRYTKRFRDNISFELHHVRTLQEIETLVELLMHGTR